MDNQKYFAAAITAFVIWGFFPMELKLLHGYGASQILYFRVVFAFVLLLILGVIRKKVFSDNLKIFKDLDSKRRFRLVFITLTGGVFITGNWLLFIYVVNNISIKTASFSYFICPVLTAVLGFLIIKENLTKVQWVSVGLCIISCIFIGFHSVSELSYSMLIASSYALYLISQRRNLEFDRLLVLTVQILFSLIIISPFYRSFVGNTPSDYYFYLHIFFIAITFTIIPLFLNLYALKGLKSATIGILMYLNPAIGFASAFILYSEKTTIFQVAGYVLIGVALVLFNAHHFVKLKKSDMLEN